ncbi:MAG: hypothetical protein CMN78_02200 [Spirochaetales bacterium]|nr:hypothetical protein [Spirochaetales bacterium]
MKAKLLIFSIITVFALPVFSQVIEQQAIDGATLPEIEPEDQGAGLASSYSLDDVLGDFEVVWKSLSDFYVDPEFAEKDWDALKDEYQTKIEESEDAATGYMAVADMIEAIEAFNTYVVPPWITQATSEGSSDIELEYAGVGILLQELETGEVMVLSVFSDTPAENAGVLLGDVIVGVNDWRVAGENPVSLISERVRGPVGTDVTLTLKDPDGAERDLAITRAKIDLRPTVDDKFVDGTVGYMRIPVLSDELVDAASKALPKLLSTRGLVLDLRGVSGGSLEATIKVAQWFLGTAQMGGFVSREGAYPLPFREDSIAAYQRPVVIVANSRTYGVAEILATIMHDYKRARIVGNVTQGGFSIGRFVDLPSGGLFHITVGLYVSPRGELLPAKGIEPDNLVEYPDLQTLRSGKDVFLDEAVHVLRTNPRL